MTAIASDLKTQLEAGGETDPFWILGPCVLEEARTVGEIAKKLCDLRDRHGFRIVFKASFDKANRSSLNSARGPGLIEGLKRLSEVKTTFQLPVLTDVHEVSHVAPSAEIADILQIPAFLCRQTDLLTAAATSKRFVNVKKGQFLDPEGIRHVLAKLEGSQSIGHWITERGVSFGYQRLIVDFAGFHVMKNLGASLIFDATHSVQLPGAAGTTTGGVRAAIPDLARAAAAIGVRGLFAEVHPDPPRAWSDASNAWPLEKLEELMLSVRRVAQAAHRSREGKSS